METEMSDSKRNDRTAAPQAVGQLTGQQVHDIIGDIEDTKVAAIVATGATLDDLEAAVAWAAGENNVMGDARHLASPTIAAVYDILTAGETPDDERG
ncbi:MAG: hypothetical protein ACREIB_03215 [Pseudomonadota bacterium]